MKEEFWEQKDLINHYDLVSIFSIFLFVSINFESFEENDIQLLKSSFSLLTVSLR